ncbi:MAG: hypothetical protein ACLP9S_00690 [Syntrophales bacterium]
MKKICSSSYPWLICLFLLIAVSAVDGNASGMIAAWEPFKTNTELGSYLVGVDTDRIPSVRRDELIQPNENIPIQRDTAARKTDSSLNVLRFHNVSVSLSRALLDQMQVDIRQSSGSDVDKLTAIKSLPSMFLNSSYRDNFESLGKIFEPQVNLSIEF